MTRHIIIVSLALLAFAAPNHAKTAQQLKDDFAGLLPAGYKARLVWTQTVNQKSALFVVDSDSGVIRQVTASVTMNAWNPHFTGDGSKICFFDWDRGETRIIGWDGQGVTTLYEERFMDCWTDPATGTDYAITCSQYSNIVKINVNTKATSMIWNQVEVSRDNNISLSKDGTHFAAYFNAGGGWSAGVADIASGSLTLEQGSSGCVVNITPDNLYGWMHQISGHKEIKISSNATTYQQFNIVDSILSWANRNGSTASCASYDAQFMDTRWSNHRDYITFRMDNVKANPYLMRLSDRKWMYLQEDIPCQGSPMDAIIYQSTKVRDPGTGLKIGGGSLARGDQARGVFTFDGRRFGAERLGVRGDAYRGMVVRRGDGSRLAARIVY